ncbi:HEAT repeat domain-containing protein [Rubrobacter marinus]|nr:HEAT repeat domain-containing protein [Rubrobacter marinus]
MIRWPRSWEWDILATLMSERLARVERIGAERERLSEAAVEIGLARRYAGMLHSPRRWYRARAAENLGHFGGEEAVALLGRLLDDRDETVRAVAARALARIGTGETARLLARTLEDPSELTRLRVAENLQRVGPAAEEPLAQVLSRQNGAGAVLAAQVLGNLGADVARAELARAARGAASTDLRAQATLALGKISNPGDLPTLLGAAEDPAWPVRAQAANALGMVGDPEAVPVLRGLVSDGEWWVRLNAARALAGLGTPGEGPCWSCSAAPTGSRATGRRRR